MIVATEMFHIKGHSNLFGSRGQNFGKKTTNTMLGYFDKLRAKSKRAVLQRTGTVKVANNNKRWTAAELDEKCTIRGEFVGHWTTHWYDEDEKHFRRRIWLFYACFKVAIVLRIMHVIRFYKHPNFRDLPMHTYMGAFSKFMGGPMHYTELIALFWSVSESLMYLLCVFRPKRDFVWLKIFIYLNKKNIQSMCAKQW